MPLTLSKAILGVEAVVLFALSGIWFFVMFLPGLFWFPRQPHGGVAILMCLATILFISVAAYAMYQFLYYGVAGLHKLSMRLWALGFAGVLFSTAMVVVANAVTIEIIKDVASYCAFGLLFTIPLIHLFMERTWRSHY